MESGEGRRTSTLIPALGLRGFMTKYSRVVKGLRLLQTVLKGSLLRESLFLSHPHNPLPYIPIPYTTYYSYHTHHSLPLPLNHLLHHLLLQYLTYSLTFNFSHHLAT